MPVMELLDVIPPMHKGLYSYLFANRIVTETNLAGTAVYVSVPLQPYIVEICDSLRGKIFQKFIER